MKIAAKYFLIIFVAFSTLNEVQGESDKRFSRNENGNKAGNIGIKTKRDINVVTPAKNSFIKPTSSGIPHKPERKFYSRKNRLRNLKTAKDSHVLRSLSTQRIYCRQITKTEVNNRGDIIETIQHICAPLQTPTATPTTPFPYADRRKAPNQLITSTVKGINCRRVMNSELNELGEIIDSVTEVCDTPTTTTRKPILYTTPKIVTTTAKPLVKVCWPVMDSYLNEEGKIIDSVSTLCKMQPVK